MAAPEIVLRGVTVAFGGNVALRNVTLELPPGLRQAVVGENGAGKSTLMRVLFGLLTPDAGEVVIEGAARRFSSPAEAIALGIGMVQQHFELIPSFTVAENVVLGAEPRRGILLDKRGAEAAVKKLAEESGLPVDPAAQVSELSVAAQQRVEILKALNRNARVLILDEPTATLAPSEAKELWAATRRLSDAGTTIVFVTHKLDEVMAQAEHVTVLRRGERVLSVPVAETTPQILADAMVGSDRQQTADSRQQTNAGIPGAARLIVESVMAAGRGGALAVNGASLRVRAGEIVGLAGVDGSGQLELLEAILGLRRLRGGSVRLNDAEIGGLSIAARRALGIAYIPEDRHHRALILPFACEENAILGRQRDAQFAGAGGILRRGAITAFFTERAKAFDVRGAGVGIPARSLSGGNQQKLVLARELSRKPSLIVAAQPTRGLDFAATAFVHDALRRERDRGAAVLVQSLDLDEILALSDRIAVMLQGQIVGILDRADATEGRIGAMMTGARAERMKDEG